MRLHRSIALIALTSSFAAPGFANTAKLDRKVATCLQEFKDNVPPRIQHYVAEAKGVLVFPGVLKAGVGWGAEYGRGALMVGGKTVDYYSVAGGSLGFQLGAQSRSQIVLFMTDEALANFRASHGWKAGVDGSIAVVALGAGGQFLTPDSVAKPILGFVFGAKGLMYNLSLEGQKYSRVKL